MSLFVLAPGEPMGMYHWEADQEDFLVLSGEALLIVEGGERPCAGGTSSLPCGPTTSSSARATGPVTVLAVGAPSTDGTKGGAASVEEVALRHGAGDRAGDQRRRRGLRGAADSQAD